jgi:dynein heavy chain
MPLIEALQDVSMRPRHWKEIRMELKDDFDEDGEDFSLEKIYGLNLLTYQEKIFDVTENAKKQLKIESGLKTIDRVWTYEPQSELVIAKDRSRADNSEFYYVKDTGEIMQLIEDHGGHLGQFKSSPYYKEFQEDIDNWEQRIAQVTETLETLMTVQKLWQYLEQIFKGQQDIQK